MDWETNSEGKLTKEFNFKNFLDVVEFVNKIALITEEMDHHPDLLIHSYNKLKVMLFTHSENKITDKDRTFAEKVDKL
jgi:4a-hydroxytetrahydrobiopterin dehydratase